VASLSPIRPSKSKEGRPSKFEGLPLNQIRTMQSPRPGGDGLSLPHQKRPSDCRQRRLGRAVSSSRPTPVHATKSITNSRIAFCFIKEKPPHGRSVLSRELTGIFHLAVTPTEWLSSDRLFLNSPSRLPWICSSLRNCDRPYHGKTA
jgi:hypothetical protein